MPPPPPRYGGGPNNISNQYSQYIPQSHPPNLPPPSMGSGNPSFMNPSSTINPFANGNALSLGQGFGGGAGALNGSSGMFASHEAQTRFHNANQQGVTYNGVAEQGGRVIDKSRIRQVWSYNLEDEMRVLRAFVDLYPYISMDIEFPGCVARPIGTFRNKSDYHYQCIRTNVDLLNVIQIGLTLFNEKGEPIPARLSQELDAALRTAPGIQNYRNGTAQLPTTWQFNFRFSLKDDMYADSSIKLLREAGVDFESLETKGIEPSHFGAKLLDSGLVCDDEKHWISFHGGYDFGYLTKILHPLPLPDDEQEFDSIMKMFFPSIWDVKYLLKWASKQQQGARSPDANATDFFDKIGQGRTMGYLDNVAEALKVKRIGTAHQAGSDALTTGKCLFAVRDKFYNGELPKELNGKVWGLYNPIFPNDNAPTQSTPQYHHQQLQENHTPEQLPNGASYTNGVPRTPKNGRSELPSGIQPPVPAIAPGGAGGAFGAFHYAKGQ